MNTPKYKYVCSNNPEHLFEEATADFWCPHCDISTRPMLKPFSQPTPAPQVTKTEETENKPAPAPTPTPAPAPVTNAEPEEAKPKKKTKPPIQEYKIGTQVWMMDFLSTVNLNDGTPILHAKTGQEWLEAKKNRVPAWCFPNGDATLGQQIGLLYNFYVINHPAGMAPKDWDIPSAEDVRQLMRYGAAGFLDEHLRLSRDLEIGHRLPMGTFVSVGDKRLFWTRTKKVLYTAHGFSVDPGRKRIDLHLYEKSAGFFIRCIKKVNG